ncbi:related to cell surface spherulin 4-like protein [Rhynchosporium agropyri]|uniref:Related to cell surface spherulin 4-like protein n=1 Tax=Rhynchosporium agropyri TaxID=914238 RepID=A0A1E1LB90_9HELO|nr:related to cell surface spherulin 4-like protein [Rhynchosporium agropyri]
MKSSPELHSSSDYEHPKPARRNCKSRFCGVPLWILSLLVSLVVITAIVVPIAVMFGRKKNSSGPAPRSAVLVPLYVYPDPGAWDPLFEAAERYPDLNFTAVVNPASGPGDEALPDGNYTRDISKLNSYPNVRTVGYVSTRWTSRNISLALADIQVYSRWATNSSIPNLGMRGIFLDETPSIWNASAQEYLENVAAAIRSDAGLGSDPLIIQNPGTIPDQRFMPSCNLSVVFEGTYETYQIYGFHKTISTFQSSSKNDRSKLAAVVHNFPPSLSSKKENKLVKDLRRVAGSVFLTGLSVDYYSSFWDGWAGFAQDMAAK